MDDIFNLNYQDALDAANKAFDDGRLGFQTRSRAEAGCKIRYRDGGCCAIGASVDPKVDVSNGGQISNERTVDDRHEEWFFGDMQLISDDPEGLLDMQIYHDNLCHKVLNYQFTVEDAEAHWDNKYVEYGEAT